jgi:hypothetical protein
MLASGTVPSRAPQPVGDLAGEIEWQSASRTTAATRPRSVAVAMPCCTAPWMLIAGSSSPNVAFTTHDGGEPPAAAGRAARTGVTRDSSPAGAAWPRAAGGEQPGAVDPHRAGGLRIRVRDEAMCCSAMPVEASGPQNGRLHVPEHLPLESAAISAPMPSVRGASWATTHRPVHVIDSATVAKSSGPACAP